jgi:transposase
VQGRHPLQTSDALGAAAQIGPRATATAAVLHTQHGLPLGRVASFYHHHFGLTITAGGLVHALHRAARQATPTYVALIETVRQSLVVVPDETGWKVGGQLQWLWVYATSTTTLYAIQAGRGFDEAAAILGQEFDGALVRDGWAPYRQFTAAIWQSCVDHLLRRSRTLQDDYPRSTTRLPCNRQVAFQSLPLYGRGEAEGRNSYHGLERFAAEGEERRRARDDPE